MSEKWKTRLIGFVLILAVMLPIVYCMHDWYIRIEKYNCYLTCTQCGYDMVCAREDYCKQCGSPTYVYAVAEVQGQCQDCGKYLWSARCPSCGGYVSDSYMVHKSDISLLDQWYVYGWNSELSFAAGIIAIVVIFIIIGISILVKHTQKCDNESEKKVVQ